MNNDYLDFIIFLERTLASFYEHKKNEPQYDRIKPLLEFMETHSSEHAEKIKELKITHNRPVLDENIIVNYHNNLTQEVFSRIIKEKNLATVLKDLADSEEELGRLYKKIAQYLIDLSEHYKYVAGVISTIGDEEYNHRDILLRDRDMLMKKK